MKLKSQGKVIESILQGLVKEVAMIHGQFVSLRETCSTQYLVDM